MITTWDDNPGSELNDYACKQWSGLLNDYYAKRWEIYFQAISPSVSGKEPFNRELFLNNLADFEKSWVRKKNRYPSTPNGDAIDVAREMVLKYKPVMLSIYGKKSVF